MAGAPARPWLLATVPRTGSTFVSHLLWGTGCLGAPLEYLNFEPSGPYGHLADDPAGQQRQWREVIARRTSPNGVFGLKAFPLLMEDLGRMNRPLLAEVMRMMVPEGSGARVVQLRRRDAKAHAVSYARALLSGVWRKEQESEEQVDPDFSRTAFDRAERLIVSQERAWQDMYAGLGIDPLVIWYEDVLADPEATVAAVAEYLEVRIDPSASVDVPLIERQSRRGTARWLSELEDNASKPPHA